MTQPIVLITNDDGVHAPGIKALAAAMAGVADVYVVAPDREVSACAQSLTLKNPLRVEPLGDRVWSVDGTPADCVNLALVKLLPRRPDAVFSGNYWSGNEEPDLDGDGRSDRPYRLASVFDHLRGNLTAADILSDSFAASAIGAAERAFPVLRAVPVEDAAPLAAPPRLDDVPQPSSGAKQASSGGIAASLALALAGAGVLSSGRRPRSR